MIGKSTRYILHPIFLAMYPVLFLLSINVGQIPTQQSSRALVGSLLAALLLTALMGIITRNIQRGALFASIVLILFFSYGHVYNLLERSVPVLANHIILTILWVELLGFGLLACIKVKNVERINYILSFISLFLLLQPIVAIASFLAKSGSSQMVKSSSLINDAVVNTRNMQDLPDIYYIILDGHGRSDVVQEMFGYDNSSFIQGLKQRGFYVADQSHSNYIQTMLSISSSLNLNYLNLDGINPESSDRTPLKSLIDNSEVRQFLDAQGYQIVSLSTGFDTTIADSDIRISCKAKKNFNNFEELLLTTSLVDALDENIKEQLFVDPFNCDDWRTCNLNIFENLRKIPASPGPKFVFAHILVPHPPFIFDENGNPTERGECRVNDGSYFVGSREDYLIGYPQQLAYTDKMISDVIDAILEKSATPPVIIIQGDHGSGIRLWWDAAEKTCMRERTSILNAYYIPGENHDQLYETITPVNSFRVVINEVFNLNMPLLEDKVYFSGWYTPYQLIDVTNIVEEPCKPSSR